MAVMNSDEDARLSQLLRMARGREGAAGGGRDKGGDWIVTCHPPSH